MLPVMMQGPVGGTVEHENVFELCRMDEIERGETKVFGARE